MKKFIFLVLFLVSAGAQAMQVQGYFSHRIDNGPTAICVYDTVQGQMALNVPKVKSCPRWHTFYTY